MADSEIRVKITLDTAGYESGFMRISQLTDSGVSKIANQATQAATAVGALGRAYQQNAAAFTQAWNSVDQIAARMATVAQQYTAAGVAFQKASTQFNQGGALTGLIKEFFGLSSSLATKAGNDIKAFGERFSGAIPGINALDAALQHVGINLNNLGKVAGFTAIFGAMAEGIREAALFEDAFADVRRQVEFAGDEAEDTSRSFEALGTAIRKISSDTGIASTELAKIAAEAGHLGLQSVDSITRFTEAIGKTSVVTGIAGKQLASSFSELAIQMGDTIENAEKMGSALVFLGNHGRATESEILGMSTAIGGMAKQLGLTVDQTLGFGAALASVGAQPMAVTRMVTVMNQAVRDGGGQLDVFAQTARMTNAEFQNLVRSGGGAEAISRFFEGLKADGERGTVALEALGLGTGRTIKSFLLLANATGLFNKDISLLRENLNNAGVGYNDVSKLQEEFAVKMDTVIQQLKVLKNAVVEVLITTFGHALGPIKAVTEALTGFVRVLDEHPALAKTVGIVVELTAGVIGLGLAFRGITAVLGTALTGLGSFFKLLETVAGTKLFAGFVTQWVAFTKLFEGGIVAAVTRFGAAIASATSALVGGGGLAAAIGALATPVGWVVIAVTAVVAALALLEYKTGLVSKAFAAAWESLKEFGAGLVDIWEKDVMPAITEFVDGISAVAADIWTPLSSELKPVIDAITDMWNFLYEDVILPIVGFIGTAIVETFRPIIDAYQYVTQRGRDAMNAQAAWVNESTQGAMNAQREMERASENSSKTIVANAKRATDAIGGGWKGLSKQQQSDLKAFDQAQATSLENRITLTAATNEVLVSLGQMSEYEQIQAQLAADEQKLAEAGRHRDRMMLIARSQVDGQKEAIAGVTDAYLKSSTAIVADQIKLYGKLELLAQQNREELDKDAVMRIDASEKANLAITELMKKNAREMADIGVTGVDKQIRDFQHAAKDAADSLDLLIQKLELTDPALAATARAASGQPYEKLRLQIKVLAEDGLREAQNELAGTAAAFGLTGEAAYRASLPFAKFGKAYADLDEHQKSYVDQRAPVLAYLEAQKEAMEAMALATQLVNAGLKEQDAIGEAFAVKSIEREEAKRDLRIRTNETILNAEKNRQVQEATLLAQDGQRYARFGDFIVGTTRKFVAESSNAWEGMGKAIIDVFGQVQRSLSDVLFNYFTTGTFKLADAWKSLMNSMLRTLSDFLAQQAVRAFLALVFGTESGGGLMGGGGGIAGAAGSLGASVVGGSGSSGLLGGLVSSGVSALKGLFSGAESLSTSTPTASPTSSGNLFGSSYSSPSVSTDLFNSGSFSLSGGSYGGGFGGYGYDLGFSSSLDSSFLNDYSFASGGPVPGHGSGDTVPAMLTPGEFVVRAPVAQAYRPLLTAINDGGAPQVVGGRLHFAAGGAVPTIFGDPAVASLLLALYQQAAMQTVYGQMTAINTGSTAAALGGTAARATGISGTGGNVVPTTTTAGGAPLGGLVGGGAASSIPRLNANFSPSMVPTPQSPSGGFDIGRVLSSARPYASFALSQLLNSGSSILSQFSPAQIASFRTALTTGTFDTSQFSPSQLSDFSAALFGPGAGSLTTPTGAPQVTPDLGTALLSGDTSGFHLIDTHLNDPTQSPSTSGPSGSALGILGAGAGTAGGIWGLIQNAQAGSGLGTALSGISTIASAYSLLQQLLPANTLPSLTELVGSGINSVTGSLGGLSNATVGAGAFAAIQAAIQIAMLAMDDSLSDSEKAIQATYVAAKAVAAVAAPATFGASLAVFSIIDFVERMRAGQDLDYALVQANDPTSLLGIRFGNASDTGILGAIESPSMTWLQFGKSLAENFEKGGMAMNSMVEQLNYVQTKEQLGAVLNAYRAKVKEYTGWDWFGADTPDPYRLPPFPEAGGSAHEGGITFSFGEPLAAIQNMVDQLLAILPGERITSLSYFDTGVPGMLQGAAYNQAHPEQAGGLFQEGVAIGTNGETTVFGTQVSGTNYPVWSPNGSGGITATTYSNTDLGNAIAAGSITGPIFDPRQGTWGYVWTGTTAASLGIPDAASLLSPFYRNFGQSLAPQLNALSSLAAPTVTSVSAVRPDYGSAEYWAAHPDEFQALVAQEALFNVSPGGMAAGGPVTGGVWGVDSVWKKLMPGEWVIPQPEVRSARARGAIGPQLRSLLGDGAAAAMGPGQVNYNVSLVVNGNVDDPEELVRVLAPRLRDELKRIDPRYSRAGNKTQV